MKSTHPHADIFFKKNKHRYIPIIDDISYKEEAYPYSKWLNKPTHFAVSNELISVTFKSEVTPQDCSASQYLSKLQPYVLASDKSIEVIDVKLGNIDDNK